MVLQTGWANRDACRDAARAKLPLPPASAAKFIDKTLLKKKKKGLSSRHQPDTNPF